METGTEVILRGALTVFAAELSFTPDELHHIERLSDDAMLAEIPHQSVEHRITCARQAGVLHWLVPDLMLRPRVAAGSVTREKR
jgi:hypothetical protein